MAPPDLAPPPARTDDVAGEMARIRAELDALRKSLGATTRSRPAKKAAKKKK